MNNIGKILLGVLILISVIIYYNISISTFDSFLFDISAIVLLISLAIFVLFCRQSQVAGCWLKPSNLFIIGYLAVNIQYLLDYRLGLKDNSSTLITYPETLNYCIVIGVAGFLAFVLGYIWKRERKNMNISSNTVQEDCKIPTILIVLHFILFCLFVLTINVSDFMLGSAYVDEAKRSPYESLFYLVTMVLVLYISRQKTKKDSLIAYIKVFPKLSIALIALYMTLRMFSGDRGPMIYTGLLLIYGYISATKKKWRLSLVMTFLISASLFVSLVGMARLGNLNDSFFDRIVNSYNAYTTSGRFGDSGEQSVLSATEELGFSFMVNQDDVKAIEQEGESFHYGMYQVYSLLVAIPYMPSFLAETLKIPEENLSSVGFANKHHFGDAESTWSIGTTLVADFYLEFGIFGVILGLFICGRFFRFIDYSIFVIPSNRINIYLLYVALHFASQAIYIPRSVLLLNLQKVLLGFVIIYILNKTTSVKNKLQ